MSSANVFLRLTRLLPTSQTLIGRVVAHDEANDTSIIELFNGTTPQAYAPGVSAGNTFTARSRVVAVGDNALVRDGVVIARAPSSAPSDVVVGTVVAQPQGPLRLALADPAPALPAAQVAAAYSGSLAAFFTGGYPPLVYALASGSLPAGLALAAASGLVTGTPSTAGSSTFAVRCTDSTRRVVTAAPMVLTVAP